MKPSMPSVSLVNDLLSIHHSHTLSASNLQTHRVWKNSGINDSFLQPGIGLAHAIVLLLQLSLASGVLPFDNGTGFTFWAKHMPQVYSHTALVVSSTLYFSKSKYKENGRFLLRSGAMLLLETDAKVVNWLTVTLQFFTWASTLIDHPSATILLTYPPTTSPSFSSHLSSLFTPLTISFLTALNSPSLLTDCCRSSFNVSCRFTLYTHSTFPASDVLLSTTSNSFPFQLFKLFSFHQLHSETPISHLHRAGPYPPLSCLLKLGLSVSRAASKSVSLVSWKGSNKCHQLWTIHSKDGHLATATIKV